ncbi:hypothetical protein NDU88_009889 [Pleurodeles waltl]|uniref:Uncharacterized protein n=1 Tax=Pleurodeles waltl TaxID=8319 RepID=A0AAV7S108_PLEWA|nr:hypothetical protein NDU88_009889 [Pleurodeles waltl]
MLQAVDTGAWPDRDSQASAPEINHGLLSATPAQVDPIHQLECTLEKHTGMFDKVLQAELDSKTAIEAQLRAIPIENGFLQEYHAKLTRRANEAESSLTSIRPSLVVMRAQLKTLQTEVRDQKARVEDAKRCS